ncbi:hypothetical protein [Halomonas sp. LBP4]|uniref:hypothetical protein n=1 Tax=Halomonas sp. LBP4 TaxID=2044917 RepID=UPI000D7531C1|nr:hypothetical protein [Halomonas sp. LBP4]PXX95838.1 hypothetical protein CR157_16690 [Halomonas sp. LBP4]
MKTLTKLTGIALLATTIAGCATTATTTRYSEDNSRAYNLAQAGGLYKARDTALGDEEYSSAMTNITNAFSDAALFNSSAGLGLSGGTSLGLGLAGALFAAPGHMERDSAFAFVPVTEANNRDEANDILHTRFFEAVQQSAADLGFSVDYTDKTIKHDAIANRTGTTLALVNEQRGCYSYESAATVEQLCIVSLLVPPSRNQAKPTPQAVGLDVESFSYPATNHNSSMRYVFKAQESADISSIAVAAKISANMPSWFYIYLSPTENQPPMILERGEPQLFIKTI